LYRLPIECGRHLFGRNPQVRLEFASVIRDYVSAFTQFFEYRLFGAAAFYRRRGTQVGRDVVIMPSARLTEPHLCVLGNNVRVGQNVILLNHDGAVVMLHRAGLTQAVNAVGKIVLHDNVFIGMRSTIMPNVEIGPNAIVAAASVVTKDVPPNSVVGGSPAKFICTVDEYLEKYNLAAHQIWVEREPLIQKAVTRFFMREGRRGKWAIRLRKGKTPLTS
jgi:acetyltransferase-like isoleucine patch superfamily enzyme